MPCVGGCALANSAVTHASCMRHEAAARLAHRCSVSVHSLKSEISPGHRTEVRQQLPGPGALISARRTFWSTDDVDAAVNHRNSLHFEYPIRPYLRREKKVPLLSSSSRTCPDTSNQRLVGFIFCCHSRWCLGGDSGAVWTFFARDFALSRVGLPRGPESRNAVEKIA